MQWKITQVEAAYADQEEKMRGLREDEKMWRNQAMRAKDANVDLNMQIMVQQEKHKEALRKIQRLSGTEDERAKELECLSEKAETAWEVAEHEKKRADEAEAKGNQVFLEKMARAQKPLEEMQWKATNTGQCFHFDGCRHLFPMP